MFTLQLTSEDTTFQQNDKNDQIDQYLFRIAAGDQNAFSALYRATRTGIYAYALSVLKNTQDAEDVLQDCFLHIYHAASTYQSCGKPMAWIITIARNLCVDEFRKTTTEELKEDILQKGFEEEVVDRQNLRLAMETLTKEEQELLLLRYVNEVSFTDLCRLYGKSRFALYRELTRIKEKLAHRL